MQPKNNTKIIWRNRLAKDSRSFKMLSKLYNRPKQKKNMKQKTK